MQLGEEVNGDGSSARRGPGGVRTRCAAAVGFAPSESDECWGLWVAVLQIECRWLQNMI
jgi:hypothetical protein